MSPRDLIDIGVFGALYIVTVGVFSLLEYLEPSSGVDRRHLESITRAMRDIAASGAVVVLISHDADLLALAADQELRLCPLRT
ncbi:hypothetical protein IU427_23225 [Nocardia beijingensis]|uniref:hypothetical protein n=1 Tax=Nocardia beijingensis TaxID=95162 RepID=UPI0018958CA0|nr:hypothetical protein [Nocardia beijingensis]MBF6468081.1 hypothetical protein [Nocardia beijingensis]